jgi:Uncharacterized protein conserved in bacteria (DUF2312)
MRHSFAPSSSAPRSAAVEGAGEVHGDHARPFQRRIVPGRHVGSSYAGIVNKNVDPAAIDRLEVGHVHRNCCRVLGRPLDVRKASILWAQLTLFCPPLVLSLSADLSTRAYLQAADAIQHKFNCVVIIHHCGQDQSRPRGHSSQIGAGDVQISVKKDAAGTVISTVELAKDMSEGTTIASRLEVVELGVGRLPSRRCAAGYRQGFRNVDPLTIMAGGQHALLTNFLYHILGRAHKRGAMAVSARRCRLWRGFDVRAIRTTVRLRHQDTAERDERQTLIDEYMAAFGKLADLP